MTVRHNINSACPYVSPIPTYPEVLSIKSYLPINCTKITLDRVQSVCALYLQLCLSRGLARLDQAPIVFTPEIRRLFSSNISDFPNLANLPRRTLARPLCSCVGLQTTCIVGVELGTAPVSLTHVLLPSVSSASQQAPYSGLAVVGFDRGLITPLATSPSPELLPVCNDTVGSPTSCCQ